MRKRPLPIKSLTRVAVCFAMVLSSLSASAQDVVLDFTENNWNFPTTDDKGVKQDYTYNGITISLNGKFKYTTYGIAESYYLYVNKDATVTLPAFDKDVEKIVLQAADGTSKQTQINVKVGSTAVSTKTTGWPEERINEYAIAENYQTAGNQYKIVFSTYAARLTFVKIYFKDSADVNGVIANPAEATPAKDAYYTLQGQYAGSSQQTLFSGVYINNGRKIVVR